MYPILVLSVTGLVTLFLGFLKTKKILLPASLLFVAVAFLSNLIDWNKPGLYFYDMLEASNLSILFTSIILLSAFLIIALSKGFIDDEHAQPAEYFAILQFSLVGAIMMTNFQNLIMLFIGVEILSVSMYILTGSDKRNIRGNEAALKYFLMGAFATGIMLFGIAMLYGANYTFNISDARTLLLQPITDVRPVFLYVGVTFLLIGLLFKVSAAPFHFWTPDVYEGAPTIFTTFMSTIVKTAGFAAIYRILEVSFSPMYNFWWVMIIVMAILSLLISNITAVAQSSFKRMLAFSSISHAGYMLLAIVGLGNKTGSSIVFYSLAYSLATISAFGVLIIASQEKLVDGRPDENISVLNGLAKKNPFLAAVLTVSMLSLAGIPLTAGFWGKFYVFADAASRGHIWLLVVAILMSAVGIYYYFKPIIAAYMKEGEGENIQLSSLYKIILGLTTLGSIILGLFPDLVRELL
ncbi:NADH-quinone oxidoreductase subunit N [Emticicia aquatica]|jgi:NADH-quinone oxidoreductase subunit N|uniref:NADH-quinone oxidoreductase subunit N n=1 Tax=Emticicia aquatica TaxID=1681835 RepID=A0ABM9ATQ2_9BACT|nr:NADH-quinone oxidoreductase subunit N [Emticicia aquatica]CAH0996672.1 NADH-quinone oxidoreductase subunit N [Emticicia aquatica]